MNSTAHQVWRAVSDLLTPTEFRLLRFFLLNPGRVVSKAQILDHVWHYDFGGDTNILETYVSYLRRKLNELGPPLIHTVRLVGYVLREDPEDLMSLRRRLLLAVLATVLVPLAIVGVLTYALVARSQLPRSMVTSTEHIRRSRARLPATARG